jgi:hypothetical protein
MSTYCNAFPGIYIENLDDRVFFDRGKHGGFGDDKKKKMGYEFKSRVTMYLHELRSRPLGKRLIQEISDRCRRKKFKVMILYNDIANCGPYPKADSTALAELVAGGEVAFRKGNEGFRKCVGGKGTHAAVFFNPDNKMGADGNERPVAISLAHELIHAHHFVHGTCARVIRLEERNTHLVNDLDCGLGEEEARTIGLGPYANEELSENAFRLLYNQPLRTFYIPSITLKNVVRTG